MTIRYTALFFNQNYFDLIAAWFVIQIAIRDGGGIDLILLASKNHIANAVVQESVCGLMHNISDDESCMVPLL